MTCASTQIPCSVSTLSPRFRCQAGDGGHYVHGKHNETNPWWSSPCFGPLHSLRYSDVILRLEETQHRLHLTIPQMSGPQHSEKLVPKKELNGPFSIPKLVCITSMTNGPSYCSYLFSLFCAVMMWYCCTASIWNSLSV